tara:strand:- start:2555 stop:3040 length:486 start_codon:yes stop_codon:yes gene_type:complete
MRHSIFTKEEDMKLLSHMESFPSMTKMSLNQWIKQFSLIGKNHQQIHSRWRGLTSKNSKFIAAKVADSEIKRKISEFKESLKDEKVSTKDKWDTHVNTKNTHSKNRSGMLEKIGISGDVSKIEMEDYKYEDGKITASKVTFFFKILLIVTALGAADYLNFI